jgi:hypothetical protein
VRSTDWLTAALVLITAFYAWQNWRMAREMAQARATAILPHLALDWHVVGPMHAMVRVASVGVGPALDVSFSVTFVPIDPTEQAQVRQLTSNVMAPGTITDLMPVFGEQQPFQTMEQIGQVFARIELSGTMKDAAGRPHEIQDALTDLANWQRAQAEAHVRWTNPEPEKRLASALQEVIRSPSREITQALKAIALRMPSDPR